jgi:hypothetical protein
MTPAEDSSRTARYLAGTTLEQLQAIIVWLFFASTFVAIIEPAPCDVIFILVLLIFSSSGLMINSTLGPMILLLLLYNIGALVSYLQIPNDTNALMFVLTSTYMATTAIFLALYIGQNTLFRITLIRNALIVAGVLATIPAIAGYFSVGGFQGGAPQFQSDVTAFNRADGLFKDPNVYATYVVFPALLLLQGFMLGTQRHRLISSFSLFAIVVGIFLAFSRGAWINFLMSTALLIGLTFVLTPSKAMRRRIVVFFVTSAICFVVMFLLLLSIEQVRELFLDRFTLVKNYDAGETGRFANQLNSIPLLLELPLGFGPLRFTNYFTIAPHNTYVNAFSSYGWLGGISYLVLIILSIIVGLKSVLMRTPWQNFAIVVFCPLVSTIFQGVQIDTDHWRHFYWLLGLNWGLFAASFKFVAKTNDLNLQHVYTEG